MTKRNNATRRRPTTFDQVPLEVVKKIVALDAPTHDHTTTDEQGEDPIPENTTRRSVSRRPIHRHKR